ncbi:hypothetical protein ZWY2020_059645 [Hordeum vulgare]|nr:hypothetical protein ZWY2020_059645 [Hordeum vulgare]
MVADSPGCGGARFHDDSAAWIGGMPVTSAGRRRQWRRGLPAAEAPLLLRLGTPISCVPDGLGRAGGSGMRLRGTRWSLSTLVAWHRGGAGDRLGGGGLDPHRPARVFGGGGTVASAFLPTDSVLAHLSSMVWSSRLLVVFHGRWGRPHGRGEIPA